MTVNACNTLVPVFLTIFFAIPNARPALWHWNCCLNIDSRDGSGTYSRDIINMVSYEPRDCFFKVARFESSKIILSWVEKFLINCMLQLLYFFIFSQIACSTAKVSSISFVCLTFVKTCNFLLTWIMSTLYFPQIVWGRLNQRWQSDNKSANFFVYNLTPRTKTWTWTSQEKVKLVFFNSVHIRACLQAKLLSGSYFIFSPEFESWN